MVKEYMTLGLPRLPLDLATFKRLRNENYLYVDKTRHAYNLIKGGSRFFLSRPRRFGKSLLISMLHDVLRGNRDLFRDLWIDKSDYDWVPHGVIAFDFSSFNATNPGDLSLGISERLSEIIDLYGLDIVLSNANETIDLRRVVHALHKRFGRVAILIDEYDSPVLRRLSDKKQAEIMRDALHGFFSAIKSLDEYVNFVFITGVSSFAKAGVFSGMNNLRIMTMDESCADICGYTDEEITDYFSSHIEAWAKRNNVSFDEQRKTIKDWYNGYRFSSSTNAVYNPFSIMHALHKQKLENFWFSSGTPKFLIGELKKKQHDSPDVFNAIVQDEAIRATQDSLGVFDVGLTPIPSLMFQTGYLTIVGYNETENNYTLGYPNQEVRHSLQSYLLSIITDLDREITDNMALKLADALREKDIALAMQTIKQLFVHLPYGLHDDKQEKYYHGILQAIFVVAGLASHAEFATNHGRIDIVVELNNIVYVIEVKLNVSAVKAIEQIEQRKYYERFLNKNKVIILLGISFKKKKNVFDIEYETCEIA